jgi:hypothetical protein
MHLVPRDAPIPPAAAPIPAAAAAPLPHDDDGDGQHGEEQTDDDGDGTAYVEWYDMVGQRRREHVGHLLRVDEQLRHAAAADAMAEMPPPPPPISPVLAPGMSLQTHCFLCSQGVRSRDAGERGTHLFVDLLKMLTRLMDRSDYFLTDFTYRFYRDRFFPLFERAGVPPPPFYPAAILEHFSTLEHTKSPLQFLRVSLRELNEEITVLRSGQRERQHGRATDDVRVAAEVTRKRKLQLELYRMKPAEMAFYDATLDGDLVPSSTASLAPAATLLRELEGEISPASFSWMTSILADV